MSAPHTHWLSLDLTWPKGTLAIHRCTDERVTTLLSEKLISESFDHSEKLIPAVKQILEDLKLNLSQIERFITPSGPGSFTGLRIALISFKAFAAVLKQPIETVSGAECRALAWQRRFPKVTWNQLFVITQTTRLLAHCATYVNADGRLKLLGEAMVETEKLLATLAPQDFAMIDGSFNPQMEFTQKNVVRFPLQAAWLGENLFQCASRKTHSKFNELVTLTPEYFGSSRFDV